MLGVLTSKGSETFLSLNYVDWYRGSFLFTFLMSNVYSWKNRNS